MERIETFQMVGDVLKRSYDAIMFHPDGRLSLEGHDLFHQVNFDSRSIHRLQSGSVWTTKTHSLHKKGVEAIICQVEVDNQCKIKLEIDNAAWYCDAFSFYVEAEHSLGIVVAV